MHSDEHANIKIHLEEATIIDKLRIISSSKCLIIFFEKRGVNIYSPGLNTASGNKSCATLRKSLESPLISTYFYPKKPQFF